MRLEFEPNVTPFPLIESDFFGYGDSVPHDADELLRKGVAAETRKGDRENARTLLIRATEADERSEDAWMWLASISEYPEELLAFLERVLDINPDNQKAIEWRLATNSLLAKTFVQRAIAAHDDGSKDVAAQWLDQAVSHDPLCEMAWFWKASLAEGDAEKLSLLDKVVELNPENADALAARRALDDKRSHTSFANAKRAAVGGDREKALDLVDEFLRAIPDNAEAWILRSHLATAIGDKMASLEKALSIDPENVAARSGLDFLHNSLGTQEPEPEAKPEPEPKQAINAEPAKPAVDPQPQAPLSRIRFVDEVDSGGVDASTLTVETRLPFAEKVEELAPECSEHEYEDTESVSLFDFSSDDDRDQDIELIARAESKTADAGVVCPYCSTPNDPQAFECCSCRAVLTISNIESLLTNQRSDMEVIHRAVTEMEAEWNLRDFDEHELTQLAIGHFNLDNPEEGLKYLQEAVRLNPDDLILSAQSNAIAIRLEEVRRKNEIHSSIPKGKSILVVDDSATVRRLIAGKLEKSGHNVVCAVDGVEALARIEEGTFDLILLDITMPRMDGYEVCRQIRANPEAADLPVVMISGKDGFFDKVRGRMAGTTGYVTKPFGPETLMKALETYLLPEKVSLS